MSLRLEMLQVARLAPRELGEVASSVVSFLKSRFGPGGGGLDRVGQEDVYYTIFALAGLQALGLFFPVVVEGDLESFHGRSGSGGARARSP